MPILEALQEAYFRDFSGEAAVIARGLESLGLSREQRLAQFLKEQVGKPYLFASTSSKAFDCSSLMQEAYGSIDIGIPRTAINQATYSGRLVEQEEDWRIGDMLFFRGEEGYYNQVFPEGIGHTAIYVGNGNIIHTVSWYNSDGSESGEVREELLEEVLARRTDLVVVKRIFE